MLEKTKRKISKTLLGHPTSEETKKKISESMKGIVPWNKGIPCSEEVKKKSRESHKGQIAWNKGIPMSEEAKRKSSKVHKGQIPWNKGRKFPEYGGEKCHFWKGGITILNILIRNNFKYRQWRSDIFTRDDFTCQRCGRINRGLNAHHIKSLSSIIQFYEITTIEEALECEEIWNINNGITLCRNCHAELHREERLSKNKTLKVKIYNQEIDEEKI